MPPSTRRSDSGSQDSRRSQADSNRGSWPAARSPGWKDGGALLGRCQPAALGLLQAGVGQRAGDPLAQLLGQPMIARVMAAAGIGGHGQDQQRDGLRRPGGPAPPGCCVARCPHPPTPPAAAAAGARRLRHRPAAARRPRPAAARAPPTTSRAGTRTTGTKPPPAPRSSTTHSSASTGTAATAACSNTRSGASERVKRTVASSSRRAACSRRRNPLMSWTRYSRPARVLPGGGGSALSNAQRSQPPSGSRNRTMRSDLPRIQPAAAGRTLLARPPGSRAVKWVASRSGAICLSACLSSKPSAFAAASVASTIRRSNRPAGSAGTADAARLPKRNCSRALGRPIRSDARIGKRLQVSEIRSMTLAATSR